MSINGFSFNGAVGSTDPTPEELDEFLGFKDASTAQSNGVHSQSNGVDDSNAGFKTIMEQLERIRDELKSIPSPQQAAVQNGEGSEDFDTVVTRLEGKFKSFIKQIKSDKEELTNGSPIENSLQEEMVSLKKENLELNARRSALESGCSALEDRLAKGEELLQKKDELEAACQEINGKIANFQEQEIKEEKYRSKMKKIFMAAIFGQAFVLGMIAVKQLGFV